jgi:hypothetical protein
MPGSINNVASGSDISAFITHKEREPMPGKRLAALAFALFLTCVAAVAGEAATATGSQPITQGIWTPFS